MQPATEAPVEPVSTQRPTNAPETFWTQEKPADPSSHNNDDDDGDDVLTGLPYLDVGDENRAGYKNTNNTTMQDFFGSNDGGPYDAFATFGRGTSAGGHTEMNAKREEGSSGAHPIGSERSTSSFVAPMPTFGPKPSNGSNTASPTPKPDAASAASDSQQQQLHANAAPWAPTPPQQPQQQFPYQQQYQQQPPPQQHGQPRYSHQGGPKPRPLPLPYPDAFGTSDRPLEDMLLESKRYVDFVSSVPLEQVMAWYRQNHVGSIVPPYTTPGVEQTGVERRQVFVGQLPSYLTEEGLTACLEYVYGTPNSVAFTLIRRSASQRTAPYGLVTLTSPQLVDAFRGLNRSIYVGRQNLFFANRLDQAAYTLEGNTEFQRFVSQLVECDMSRHVADQRTLGYARAAMVVGLANPPPRLTRAPQQGQGRGYGGAPNAYAAPSTHGATHVHHNHHNHHQAAPLYQQQQQPQYSHVSYQQQPPPAHYQHHHSHQQRPPHQQHQQHQAYPAPPPGPYSHAPPPPPPPSYHPPQYQAPAPAAQYYPAGSAPSWGPPPPTGIADAGRHQQPVQRQPTPPAATLSLRQAATTGPLYMMNADGHLVPVQVVGSNNPSPTVSPCNRQDSVPTVFGLQP